VYKQTDRQTDRQIDRQTGLFLLFTFTFLNKINCIKKLPENSDRLPEDGGRRSKSVPESPNMAPFDLLGMVSYYCAIVTLSIRHAVFEIFDFKK